MVPFYPDPDDHGGPRENDRDPLGTSYEISGEWRDADSLWQQGPDDSADYFLVDERDDALVDRVAERLIAGVEIRGRMIHVMVQNSVVILEGRVDSTDVKAAVGRLAWATPGVFDVCNILVAER